MRNKKGFEMPFSWMFAIVAGAVILFLAIYGVSRLVDTGKYQTYTESAKKISIALDSMGSGIADSKASSVKFRAETRLYFECYPRVGSIFGKNVIKFSEKSGIKEEWAEPEDGISVYNKYIFADDFEQGKEVYFFTKPFAMPFEVDDLILASAENYCFKNAPEEIVDEIESLGIQNVKLDACSADDIEVCFSGSCDIEVSGCDAYDCESGYVEKKGVRVYYYGNLVYGAIFASPENYECNVKRMMTRTSKLSEVYGDKIEIVQKVGCDSDIGAELLLLESACENLNSSAELQNIVFIAENIDDKNKNAVCRIY